MKFRPLALCLLTIAVLAGCATPRQLTESGRWSIGYRVDVQQGNVITQEMLAQLQPGMDKKKVGFIMGAPIIKDTFHNDRWDYIYTFQKGRKQPRKRHVTLFFKDDKLVKVAGDVTPADGPIDVDMRQDEQVEVPPRPKPNVVYRAMNAIPFIGEKPRVAPKAVEDEDSKLIVRRVVAPPPEPEPAEGAAAVAESAVDASADAAAQAATPKAAEKTAGTGEKKGLLKRIFSKDEPAAPAGAKDKPVASSTSKASPVEENSADKPGFFKRVFGGEKNPDADEDDDGLPDSGVESSPPVD